MCFLCGIFKLHNIFFFGVYFFLIQSSIFFHIRGHIFIFRSSFGVSLSFNFSLYRLHTVLVWMYGDIFHLPFMISCTFLVILSAPFWNLFQLIDFSLMIKFFYFFAFLVFLFFFINAQHYKFYRISFWNFCTPIHISGLCYVM